LSVAVTPVSGFVLVTYALSRVDCPRSIPVGFNASVTCGAGAAVSCPASCGAARPRERGHEHVRKEVSAID